MDEEALTASSSRGERRLSYPLYPLPLIKGKGVVYQPHPLNPPLLQKERGLFLPEKFSPGEKRG